MSCLTKPMKTAMSHQPSISRHTFWLCLGVQAPPASSCGTNCARTSLCKRPSRRVSYLQRHLPCESLTDQTAAGGCQEHSTTTSNKRHVSVISKSVLRHKTKTITTSGRMQDNSGVRCMIHPSTQCPPQSSVQARGKSERLVWVYAIRG